MLKRNSTKTLNEKEVPKREAKDKAFVLVSWFWEVIHKGEVKTAPFLWLPVFLFPCTPGCGSWEWWSGGWQNYCLSYSLGVIQLKHTEGTCQHFKVSAIGPAMEAWQRTLVSPPPAIIPIPGSCCLLPSAQLRSRCLSSKVHRQTQAHNMHICT